MAMTFNERKAKIKEAYRKMATDGYMTSNEAEECCEGLDTLSAADVMVEFKNHITEA
jgi:hypothetical protein